jgi:GntR family transcriptional regulator
LDSNTVQGALQTVGRRCSSSHPAGGRIRRSAMVCYITNTPDEAPMQTWDAKLPIYQQLADILAARLLDGEPHEGDPMPSVRALASQYLINPLTVNRALQALGDEGLLETRRGLGHFVRPGAREKLRQAERQRFLSEEWPQLRARLRRLDIAVEELNWEE